MDLAKPPVYLCGHNKDLLIPDPNYPWTINAQRYLYFPISQSRIKIALFGTIYSSELIVPSIHTLLGPRYGKDQTEPLHTFRGIHIYNIFGLFLSLLKSISLNPTIKQPTIYREYVIIIYFIVARKKVIISL
jgi:hypothetical protein